MKNRVLIGVVTLVSTVALGGCGHLSGSGGPDGRMVTIWLMNPGYSAELGDLTSR
ncbi:hypothetical protein AB0N06_34725 [Streptomyces sp. NPDC051020]|uniref:hypothetical protein n=1 Tax=Streptomyces sp. NPDC051020 TaxID=3155409 RepID=UPI00343778C6